MAADGTVEAGGAVERPGPAAIGRAVLLFAVGFALGAAAIRWVIGDPMLLYASERSEKFAILAQSHRPYSTLLFGSSHVNQGVDPRIFDSGATGASPNARSFNMAVDGGSQVEQRAMALEVLRHPPQGPDAVPCMAILEETSGPTFSELFTAHPRQINMLDLRSVQVVLQFHPYGWTRMYWLHRAAITSLAMFYHEINMGMLSNRIFRPPLNQALMIDEGSDDRRGTHHAIRTPESDQDVAKFFAARKYPPVAVHEDLGSGRRMVVEDLHAAPHGAQVQFVWLAMPALDDLQRYYILPESEPTNFGAVPVINMGRPDLYPELYEPELWLDDQHLNERGAALFSRLLAQAVQRQTPASALRGCQ